MASSVYVGWGIFFILASLAAAVAMQAYYTKRSWRTFPLLTHSFIVMSVFICILPFPLLVLDVDAAMAAAAAGETESTEQWLRPFWWLILGMTQVLAWAVLPIAQEYDSAGDFTVKSRLVRSVRENVKMYIIMGVVGALLLVYVIFLKGLRSIGDVLSLCFAASNAFGLLLICIFLASGLLGIPKMLWRMADPETTLRTYYFEALDMQEDLEIAAMDLMDVKAELAAIDPRVSDDHRPHLALMLDAISEADKNIPLFHTASSRLRMTKKPASADDVSLEHLTQLNARLKRAIKIAVRMSYLWESTLRNCQHYDAIVNGQITTVGVVTMNYWKYLRFPLLRTLSVVTFLLTVLVLWSELVLPFQTVASEPLSVIEIVVRSRMHFVGSTTFLFYMATCSYWATFQFKVFEVYHVLPSQSDATSLCFTSTFLTRLIIPLCYNFLWNADLTGKHNLVNYSEVFGQMNVVAILGDWFNRFIPIFIPIVAVLIEAKVFDRIMSSIGVDRHDPTDQTNPVVMQKIHDGRRLILAAMGREQVNGTGGQSPSSGAAAVEMSPNTDSPSTANPERGKRYAEYKAKRAAMSAQGTELP